MQAKALIRSATAENVRSQASRQREEALFAVESSTKERLEQVTDESDKAAAALDAQKSSFTKANAEYSQKIAQLEKAKHQLQSITIDRQKALTAVKSREAELVAKKMQRELLNGEEKQLLADLESKNSMLNISTVDLGYTTIKAPIAGTVGELKVKVGQFVNAGTNVITLVSSTPWVVANFRETQISRITAGDSAIIQVDALPNRSWRAHVESIAPASGAQFSLLPPDNASGNFTKITQRIPVKLVFEEDGAQLGKLRPGC
jgi:membrane fusion protein (multidrug efflux system)